MNTPINTPLDPQTTPVPVPASPAPVATAPDHPARPALVFAQDPRTTALVPTAPPDAAALLSFQQNLPAPASRPRKGKIAHLPKPERDMVSRMLANNIAQAKIVDALFERGFTVTQRNISNWKTFGGYKEWRAAQDQALEVRTFQDNITDFLRRHDAAELPEVGLQSAATNLSALLLRPDLVSQMLADPQKYSKLIELQCRLARELQALQKNRDAATKSVGYNAERLKREDDQDIEDIRETYSAADLGKRPGDPITPHRNYIPKEVEPAMPRTKEAPMDTLQLLHAATAARAAKPSVTPDPNHKPASSCAA